MNNRELKLLDLAKKAADEIDIFPMEIKKYFLESLLKGQNLETKRMFHDVSYRSINSKHSPTRADKWFESKYTKTPRMMPKQAAIMYMRFARISRDKEKIKQYVRHARTVKYRVRQRIARARKREEKQAEGTG